MSNPDQSNIIMGGGKYDNPWQLELDEFKAWLERTLNIPLGVDNWKGRVIGEIQRLQAVDTRYRKAIYAMEDVVENYKKMKG